jgi:hypothetical protein
MRRPATATGSCSLCDMEGSIGFSCLVFWRSGAKIWVLEDYQREVWSFKYHVKFPAEILCRSSIAYSHHCLLSHQGIVLVYNVCDCHMFHCDGEGKLLEEFQWEYNSQRLRIIGHKFKESLLEHELFSRRGVACVEQPSFFQRL